MVRDDFNILAVYIPSEKEDNMIKKEQIDLQDQSVKTRKNLSINCLE